MTQPQQQYWQRHYDELARDADRWLDYSNEVVQAQTFALALEAAGPIGDRTCLDLGCGFGHLGMMLQALGAREVHAVDASGALIERNRARAPSIKWLAGQVEDLPPSPGFDLALLVEMLQYVPLSPTLDAVWRRLSPGGRVVAVVPNRLCPIVQRAIERYRGQYAPPTPGELTSCAAALEGVETWALRGLFFRSDQRLVPYDASAWGPDETFATPPNRLLLVARKAAPAA